MAKETTTIIMANEDAVKKANVTVWDNSWGKKPENPPTFNLLLDFRKANKEQILSLAACAAVIKWQARMRATSLEFVRAEAANKKELLVDIPQLLEAVNASDKAETTKAMKAISKLIAAGVLNADQAAIALEALKNGRI